MNRRDAETPRMSCRASGEKAGGATDRRKLSVMRRPKVATPTAFEPELAGPVLIQLREVIPGNPFPFAEGDLSPDFDDLFLERSTPDWES